MAMSTPTPPRRKPHILLILPLDRSDGSLKEIACDSLAASTRLDGCRPDVPQLKKSLLRSCSFLIKMVGIGLGSNKRLLVGSGFHFQAFGKSLPR